VTNVRSTRGPRILYVQFTNPAAYPPLEHSATILAESGCDIVLLGLDTLGTDMVFVSSPGICVRLLRRQKPGWRQKLQYAVFACWAAWWVIAWRPSWVYASDPLAAPIALFLMRVLRVRVVYHEHDAPDVSRTAHTGFMSRVLSARARLVRRADLVIAPNEARAHALAEATGAGRVVTVPNYPRAAEAKGHAPQSANGALRVLYQGSIVPARVPMALVDALAVLPSSVRLILAGYETAGHPEYIASLVARGRSLGIGDRIEIAGVFSRSALLDFTAGCDVGLALFPLTTSDPNESTMIGASNKPFEYLARGLPLLVSDRPEWRARFVDEGLAVACDPETPSSIAAGLQWLLTHPTERRAKGEKGRVRVAAEWNYERAFGAVRTVLLSTTAGATASVRDDRRVDGKRQPT
jgi:glycosyltransferase involved in cell wall biosynthesis